MPCPGHWYISPGSGQPANYVLHVHTVQPNLHNLRHKPRKKRFISYFLSRYRHKKRARRRVVRERKTLAVYLAVTTRTISRHLLE